MCPRQRDRGNGIEALDTQNLLDDVGFAVNIVAPGRHADRNILGGCLRRKAEGVENSRTLVALHIEPTQCVHTPGPEPDLTLIPRRTPGNDKFAGLTATNIEDQVCGILRAGHSAFAVYATLKPVACIRFDL